MDLPLKLASPGDASTVTGPTSLPRGRTFDVTKAFSYSRLEVENLPIGDAEAANLPIFGDTSGGIL